MILLPGNDGSNHGDAPIQNASSNIALYLGSGWTMRRSEKESGTSLGSHGAHGGSNDPLQRHTVNVINRKMHFWRVRTRINQAPALLTLYSRWL